MNADLIVRVRSPTGRCSARPAADRDDRAGSWAAEPTANEYSLFLPHPRGLLQIISVPIRAGRRSATEVLGRLTAGFFLDHDRALQFKRVIDSDIAFGVGDEILASSLPPDHTTPCGPLLRHGPSPRSMLDGTEYLALATPHAGPPATVDSAGSRRRC